jgi:hypothetical protein
MNLFKYGKFFADSSYRIILFIKNNYNATYALSSSLLGDLNLSAGFKFGIFDYKVRK